MAPPITLKTLGQAAIAANRLGGGLAKTDRLKEVAKSGAQAARAMEGLGKAPASSKSPMTARAATTDDLAKMMKPGGAKAFPKDDAGVGGQKTPASLADAKAQWSQWKTDAKPVTPQAQAAPSRPSLSLDTSATTLRHGLPTTPPPQYTPMKPPTTMRHGLPTPTTASPTGGEAAKLPASGERESAIDRYQASQDKNIEMQARMAEIGANSQLVTSMINQSQQDATQVAHNMTAQAQARAKSAEKGADNMGELA
ncbi:MAG: hypothetical protein ACTHL8_01640 [Burkholderiaceae bacterium]